VKESNTFSKSEVAKYLLQNINCSTCSYNQITISTGERLCSSSERLYDAVGAKAEMDEHSFIKLPKERVCEYWFPDWRHEEDFTKSFIRGRMKRKRRDNANSKRQSGCSRSLP